MDMTNKERFPLCVVCLLQREDRGKEEKSPWETKTAHSEYDCRSRRQKSL